MIKKCLSKKKLFFNLKYDLKYFLKKTSVLNLNFMNFLMFAQDFLIEKLKVLKII